MPQARFGFPNGFLWGTATSSHQVEGNNRNNTWHAWEQGEGHVIDGHHSGAACEWWSGRWRHDFDRAAEAGQNAMRLSIEWSRVQPSPERWDEHAFDHYREMLRGLRERHITPMVTLHHFTDPLWLEESGGWENDEAIQLFESYVHKTVQALHEHCSLWCTMQEPNNYAMLGYRYGDFPPGKNSRLAASRVLTHLAQAHVRAYHAIKEIQPESSVGVAINRRSFSPARPEWLLDRLTASTLNRIYQDPFPRALVDGKLQTPMRRVNIEGAAGAQDFIGLNYYTADTVKFAYKMSDMFTIPPGADLSETGFIVSRPREFFNAIKWATSFKLPVYITENGTEDRQDDHRRRYMVEHILQLWRAVNFNYPVKGYFHWSLVDNFEWERGWSQRFGLWELARETQERKKRPSADLYAAICRENGLTTEMVWQYAPDLFEKLFPV